MEERNLRKVMVGTVTSNKMDKTVVVSVATNVKHPKYGKIVKRTYKLKAELFKLRFGLATNGLENPMKIKETKKDIARVKTILKERELAE